MAADVGAAMRLLSRWVKLLLKLVDFTYNDLVVIVWAGASGGEIQTLVGF